MTRAQLRKLLVDKVKLGYDFLITSCNHREGSINIKIPENIKDNFGSIYDYNLNGMSKEDRIEHKKTISEIRNIIKQCYQKLKNFKFRNVVKNNFNISFTFPKEYVVKKKVRDSIFAISESYVPENF